MAQRDRTAELSVLDSLLRPELDAVLAALADTPDDAEVNLSRLIERARRNAQDAQASFSPKGVFDYFTNYVASIEQLYLMRDALRSGRSPDEAMAMAVRMGRGDPKPRRIETAPQRAEQPEEPRSGVRRYRSRAGRALAEKRARKAAKKPASIMTGRLIGRGDPNRPRGAPVDWDPNAAHPPPPWEDDDA